MLICVRANVDSAESVCVVRWDGSYTISKDIINPQRPLVTTHDTISSAGPGSLLKTIPAAVWLWWSLKVTPLRPVSLFPSIFLLHSGRNRLITCLQTQQVRLAGYHGNIFDETTWCDIKQCGYLWILQYQEERLLLLTTNPSMWRRREKNGSSQNITTWKGNGNASKSE